MATIKKLNLKLLSGLLSELQSDTIFGHFAWRFKEMHGEEELKNMLKMFVSNSPWFTISDGLLERDGEVFLPKPLKITPIKPSSDIKYERINDFIAQKENKSRKLITLEELNLYLNNELETFGESISRTDTIEPPKFTNDLRISVEIDRETFKSKKGQLFSDNPMYLDKDVSISVFIKILNPDNYVKYNCDEIIKSVFTIGFGRKKSTGYGQFEILGLEDFVKFNEPLESNGFVTLSHYLPADHDNIKDAYYDINIKYGKLGEDKSKSQNPFKPGMLLIKPGSCFLTDSENDYYGRAVDNITDYNPAIVHNGIAFTLKCKL